MDIRTERIRALNDRLRATGEGGNVVITRGLAALDGETLRTIIAAVQCFDRFTADNDPYGEQIAPSLTLPVSGWCSRSTTTTGRCKAILPTKVIRPSPPAC
jgi:hypothetical protein